MRTDNIVTNHLLVLFDEERNDDRDDVVTEVEMWPRNQQLTKTTNSNRPQTLNMTKRNDN